MKRWLLISVLFGLAAATPSAVAQGSSSVTFGSLDGHTPVVSTDVPARASGQLTVSFHGDPATGCAAQGLCGYSGTVVFRPGSGADLGLVTYRIHGRSAYQVQLNLPPAPGATFTAAQVTRAGGGECSDAGQPDATLPGTVSGGQVTIGLIQRKGGLLSTRCAGPLDADLAGLGPQIRLSLDQLRRGRRTIPLSGSWPFAAGGFAGKIESNLTMTLGKPSVERPISTPKTFQQERQVTETLTLVRGTGNLSLALGGDPSACQFLDSCGAHGSLDGTFAPQGGTGLLVVLGPSKRPYADFLAALGRSRQGNPRGLSVEGVLNWPGGGTLMEQLQQPASCSNSALLPGGAAFLAANGPRMSADYTLPGLARTRCPGPELPQFRTLASGAVSRATFGQPTFTLHLSGSGSLHDDGYWISQRTTLSLTLKRGPVHERSFLAPAG